MRAIVIEKKGGPDVLELRDEPEPQAGDDELLVDVEAIGVNYRDVYEREGRGAAYGKAKLPLIVGAEGAGTVLQGAGEFSAGDRVAWVAAPASYAEQVVVPVGAAIPVPDGVESDVAAAALLQGMTAHYLCYSTYAVQAGDVVVVHAAAGGVGLLLTQMVKRLGATVIATTSTEEKAALARAAGADHTVGYDNFLERRRNWAARTSSTTASGRPRSTPASTPCARAGSWPSSECRPGRRRNSTRSACRRARSTSPAPGSRTTRRHARNCSSARARCSAGSRTDRSTCASASATRWRTAGRPTRTSKPAAAQGS